MDLNKKEVNINTRIKVFNNILNEFHNDISPNFQFKKIKKFKDFQNFQKQVEQNIALLLNKDVNLLNKISILKAYETIAKVRIVETADNLDIIFKYIKNLYYLTFENEQQANEIKSILELNGNDLMDIVKVMLSGEDGKKVQEFVEKIQEEIMPFYNELDIKGLEDVTDIQNLVSSCITGTGNAKLDNLSEEDNVKLQQLIEKIKEIVNHKVQSGEVPKNEIKKIFSKLKGKLL